MELGDIFLSINFALTIGRLLAPVVAKVPQLAPGGITVWLALSFSTLSILTLGGLAAVGLLPQPQTQPLYTAQELAQHFQVSLKTVYRWARGGKIKVQKLPGSRLLRFDPLDLDTQSEGLPPLDLDDNSEVESGNNVLRFRRSN